MIGILRSLVLPAEITAFERAYLARVNRVALVFFALHIPLFVLIAWLNHTGPWRAALLSAAAMVGPAIAHAGVRNPRLVSIVYGVTAMFMGGLLVHFGQGPLQIEMHFYFFSLIAMCAVFGNPLVVVAAAVTVALHHLVVWLLLPRSVFNYDASAWVVAVHAAFVVLESIASCVIARSFFDNVIGLEKVVHARTRSLDMTRLLLDNVQQGFLTIDRRGMLSAERSKAIDRWFGAPPANAIWFDFLAGIQPELGQKTRLAWNEVVAGIMPLELTLDQMPSRFTLNGSTHYRIEYRAIGPTEPHEHFLIIVTDVTTELAGELAERDGRETVDMFERLLVDRSGFETFFDEAASIVDSLVRNRSADLGVGKRLIHTLKGNAALFGLTSVADMCHVLEDRIAEEGRLPPPSAYVDLTVRWSRLASHIDKLLGKHPHTIEIDDQQYSGLETAVRTGEPPPALLRRVRGLKLEATSKRLNHFAEQARRIAHRITGVRVRVEIEDHGVRLDPRRWAGFWSNFIHAVRNSLDHGIEPAEVRVALGKPAEGTLTLRTYEERDRIVVEISDDGRGIDWPALAARGARAGLRVETRDDLVNALFADGVSTAASVTDLSGRGVGMGALLAGTRELGGDLVVQSVQGAGTTLRFTFPAITARNSDSVAPRAAFN